MISLSEEDGFLVPNVAIPDENSPSFNLDVSGYNSISSEPLLRDPYEDSMVEVKQSALPGGGEGLFMKKSAQAGEVIAFYNGIRFHDCHVRKLQDKSMVSS